MYYTYVLENPDGKFYVGHTENLERRVTQHNDTTQPKSKYTVKNGPWVLVWHEESASRSLAMNREKQIKSMKSSKWIKENLLNR